MKKRSIALLLSMTLMVSALTGCGASTSATTETPATETPAASETEAAATDTTVTDTASTEKVDMSRTTITFWHAMGGVNGEALDYLINKFNTDNEFGITVDAQYQGDYDETINKLKSAQLGNMGADLVQIYDIGTRFMIDSGWIVPMQELIDADGYDVSQIEPNIAAYYTVSNELYSMPFNSSTPIMYYNKDMFDKAGVTEIPASLPEIAAVADDLTSKGGAGEAISLGIYGWFFEQFGCKQGLNYVDNGNGREDVATAVEFDSNGAALNTLTEWKNLADAGVAPNVGRGGDSGLADFSAGKSAMTLGSTASLKQILEK